MSIADSIIGRAEALDHFQANAYSPYHFFSSEEWARFRADTPLTLTGDEVQAAALAWATRSTSTKCGGSICRCRASCPRMSESSQLLFEQRNRFLSLSDVAEDALRHRHRRLGGRRQVDDRPYPEGAAGALALQPEGGPHHDRRFPAIRTPCCSAKI